MYIQLQCTKKDKEIQISIKELYKKKLPSEETNEKHRRYSSQ